MAMQEAAEILKIEAGSETSPGRHGPQALDGVHVIHGKKASESYM